MSDNILESIKITCDRCGEEFEISPAEQKFYSSKGFTLPKKCKKCRSLRNEVEVFKCVDCNKEFTVNKIQREYFEGNGLEMPKRCPECRRIKRERNKNKEAGNG